MSLDFLKEFLSLALLLSFCSTIHCLQEKEYANVSCPCSNVDWCLPISKNNKTEVFAFSVKNDAKHWERYDWSKLTTVVMFGYLNQSLMCLAHSHGVRVVTLGGIDAKTMLSPQMRKAWISHLVDTIRENFLDGVNFDFENQVLMNETNLRDAYTTTVNETYNVLKSINKNYQISVDVAWKPNVDARFYDYRSLAYVSDFLFVMAYDEQSQIFGECIAGPNSAIGNAELGLATYINDPAYNIDSRKLILGVPWYGYVYQCLQLKGDKCYIKKVPFRGVNCSDASGKQYDYGYLYKTLMTIPDSYLWNASSFTPFLQYTDPTGVSHQGQFDDPISLAHKYKLAMQLNLRGVGMWNIDSLDFADTYQAEVMRREMFAALNTVLTRR